MTIIKQRTSGDGYECRLIKYDDKPTPMWEVFYDGCWMGLTKVRQYLPGRPTVSALASRIYHDGTLATIPPTVLRSTPVALWGRHKDGTPYCRSAIPSKWAAEWARLNGHRNCREIRDAFIRAFAGELHSTPDDPSDALKRTLRAFRWQANAEAIAS